MLPNKKLLFDCTADPAKTKLDISCPRYKLLHQTREKRIQNKFGRKITRSLIEDELKILAVNNRVMLTPGDIHALRDHRIDESLIECKDTESNQKNSDMSCHFQPQNQKCLFLFLIVLSFFFFSQLMLLK